MEKQTSPLFVVVVVVVVVALSLASASLFTSSYELFVLLDIICFSLYALATLL